MSSYGTRSQMSPTVIGQAESVVQRVYQAVEHLCTAPGDVRARLRGAVMDLLPLQVREFPEHLQGDFDWIRSQSTKYESEWPHEGTLDATMRRIKNSTGEKIAKRIFKLYSDIQDIRGFPLLGGRTLLVLFAVLLAGLLSGENALAQGSVAGDRAALVALYNATDGANWANNTNWLSNNPLGNWYGVTTNAGRVTTLALDRNNLTGSIPSALGNLSNLTTAYLQVFESMSIHPGNTSTSYPSSSTSTSRPVAASTACMIRR